jgi:magnesium-transporting ATPase (P-type)
MAIGGVREIKERMKIEHAEGVEKSKPAEDNSAQNSTSVMSSIDYPYVTLFFQHLALCNTVTCDYEANNRRGGGETIYKAASPDELALVLGAKNAGI